LLFQMEQQKDLELEHLRESLTLSQVQVASANDQRLNKIKGLAKTRAKVATIGLAVLLSLFIGIALYFIPFVQDMKINKIYKVMIVVFISIAPNILGLFNINFVPLFKRINNYLEKKIEISLINKYY
jgi:hypothetical protein